MTLLLAFAITLMIAALISDIARRSVLSTSVLFLLSGFMVGSGWVGHMVQPSEALLERAAELALFSVLFSDGMRTGGVGEIRRFWHLPGRALLIGMPLTIAGVAALAHYLVHLDWSMSLLIAAALSPTDPVFVSAIFGFESVPKMITHVLNIESGMNDGLALPVVLVMMRVVLGGRNSLTDIVADLLLGVCIGIVIPWGCIQLEQVKIFAPAGVFQPLYAFAIGVLVLAISYRFGTNLFLAAFAAGITVASLSQRVKESFEKFGELVAELLKLAALLLFGALIAPRFFRPLPALEYLFVPLAVFAIRPIAILGALYRTELSMRDMLTIGWFGPKGFASVVYGLMILHSGLNHVAHLIGLAIVASILVYSSTDVLIGRHFDRAHKDNISQSTQESIR